MGHLMVSWSWAIFEIRTSLCSFHIALGRAFALGICVASAFLDVPRVYGFCMEVQVGVFLLSFGTDTRLCWRKDLETLDIGGSCWLRHSPCFMGQLCGLF